MAPLVEIVVATYQGEAFLAQQLDSLLQQTHRPLRILIRDDGSTDATPTIIKLYCEKHPDLFVQLPSEGNVGIRENFSLLLQAATTPYVMFCDQDDVWFPEKVSKTLAHMQTTEDGAPCLIHTDLRVVDSTLRPIAPSFWAFAGLDVIENTPFANLSLRNQITGCTMMMNRPLIEKVGTIPPTAVMHDHWVALVASTFGRIGILPEPTLAYRQHGSNALGAVRFSWQRWLRKGLANLASGRQGQNLRLILPQLREFQTRYGPALPEHHQKWLGSLLNIDRLPFSQRLQLAKQVGLFQTSSLRNWAQGACLLLPQKKVLR